ncbi:MAG: asparagine synthase (glutamine-hydrolyzing) [Rhodospirillales bacterium]|nr:asparagine synthase (glutamine-hydrolyzing) [Rhodospirillales bacterium]
MCGIWASIGINAPKATISAISHRGPDGEGWRELSSPRGPVFLGHRRLAVIDTSSAGSQPMTDANEQLWITFNGEIFNYIELREELRQQGVSFRTQSDTEVLLAAYSVWGTDCLNRLNGMFAFVIWDKKTETLFAARDRFGIKPLYYWVSQQGIAFFSEIKQLMSLPNFKPAVNHHRVYDYLAYAEVDHTSETMFADVHQIQGGTFAHVNTANGTDINIRRWYEYPSARNHGLSANEAASTLHNLLEDSVRLRMRSDIPIGTCLSGGLDSSSIACLVKKQTEENNLVTVSACFSDPECDESAFIDDVVAHTGAKSVRVFPGDELFDETFSDVIYHLDEPFTSTSILAQWQVFKAAREAGLQVMLDGQGADEQLCGYHVSFSVFHSDLLRRMELARLWQEHAGQRRRHGTSAIWQMGVMANTLLPKGLQSFIRKKRQPPRPAWLQQDFSDTYAHPLTRAEDVNDLIFRHFFITSLPMLLRYEDRNSMAHGVESRLPFLDYRIVEFLIGLGDNFKIVDGETKWILREAMKGVLPPTIHRRQDKKGFSTPQARWLTGPALHVVNEILDRSQTTLSSFFVPKEITRLRHQLLTNRVGDGSELWRIISLTRWIDVFGIKV